ncbi:hypothetical protein HPB47_022995 [Ixodes persulcatus]|uniref:Uncharacterized protein n=1 Tax=Ixodes persulcatus TaxID=34615 RepID=A0AC60Q859_IXOPE|nr:hypothetical protein HPB47_022995 [Ixodes persulcatus]
MDLLGEPQFGVGRLQHRSSAIVFSTFKEMVAVVGLRAASLAVGVSVPPYVVPAEGDHGTVGPETRQDVLEAKGCTRRALLLQSFARALMGSQQAEPARPDQEQQEQSQEGENDVIPFDPDEFLSLGRTRRRKTLTDLVPQDPDGELPAEYSRSDRVILRRIRTNTAITPALQAKLDRARRVRHPDDPGPGIDARTLCDITRETP